MNKLGIRTYKEYLDYLFDPKNSGEIQEMIDIVSTHKTDFYRGNDHFEFMRDTFLPEYVKNNNKIDLWSAGSSSGEEAYTLAFVISEFNRLKSKKIEYKIYGSDVSLTSVKQASNGVYAFSRIEGIPLEIKKRYFLKNKDTEKKLVRVVPEIRKNIKFFKLNFLDKNYGVNKMFDVIMCRNTLIYFSREVQEEVLRKLLENLKIGGYLLIGHSESIFSMKLPVELVRTTIFRKL